MFNKYLYVFYIIIAIINLYSEWFAKMKKNSQCKPLGHIKKLYLYFIYKQAEFINSYLKVSFYFIIYFVTNDCAPFVFKFETRNLL